MPYVAVVDHGSAADPRALCGRIIFAGTPADLVAARSTRTGEHLAAHVGA